MKFLKNIRAWQRNFFRKRRFYMLNATDNSEEWHMHLSPASIFAAFLSFVLLLFILILSLVAYSRSWNCCRDTAPRQTVREKASCRTSSGWTRWSA